MSVPEEVGSSEPLFQAGWGLQRPCQPPQGQWMAGRVVILMPAPDASHSPALSSRFRLLRCLVEGSHAERVRGRASCSPRGWLCLGPIRRSENDGEAMSGLSACSPECQGSGEALWGQGDTPQPQACPVVQVLSCSRQPSCGHTGWAAACCAVIFSFVFQPVSCPCLVLISGTFTCFSSTFFAVL